MPRMTPEQERTRERFEALIGAMAPVLDLVLAVGDRVSRRFASSSGPESYPIRALAPGAGVPGAGKTRAPSESDGPA